MKLTPVSSNRAACAPRVCCVLLAVVGLGLATLLVRYIRTHVQVIQVLHEE